MGYGELRVVASRDIGDLGERQGPPVLVDWGWRHEAPGGGLWLLLPLLIAAAFFNRPQGVRPVAVALAVLLAAWQLC